MTTWLGDFVGSVFGGESDTVVPEKDEGQKGDGFFGSSQFYNSLLNAGATLAGIYFKQTGDRKLAEQAAADRMKELEAAAKLKAAGGGGGSGAALKIAKMNNLSALYQNYAQLMARGGEAKAQTAIETGRLMQQPINVRAGRL